MRIEDRRGSRKRGGGRKRRVDDECGGRRSMR